MRVLVVSLAFALAGCTLLVGGELNDAAIGTQAPRDRPNGDDDDDDDDVVGRDGGLGSTRPEAGTVDASSDAYAAAVVADGPVAFWRLEERSGSSFRDEMGGRALTLSNGARVAYGVPGASASSVALRFDNTGPLTADNVLSLGRSAQFTVEAWVRSTGKGTRYEQVFEKSVYLNGDRSGCVFWINASRENHLGFERWKDGQFENGVYLNRTLDGTRFTHVAVVQDSTKYTVFIDGAPIGDHALDDSIVDPSRTLEWGRGFIGDLDDLAVYDKALTPARIAAHRNAR